MSQLFSVQIGGHQQMVTKDVMLRERAKNGDLLGAKKEPKVEEVKTEKCPICEEGVCNEHGTEDSEEIIDPPKGVVGGSEIKEKKPKVLKEKPKKKKGLGKLFSKKDLQENKKEKEL